MTTAADDKKRNFIVIKTISESVNIYAVMENKKILTCATPVVL